MKSLLFKSLLLAPVLLGVTTVEASHDLRRELLCSTLLQSGVHEKNVFFNLGNRTESGQYYAFQPPTEPDRVLLEGSFMAYRLVSDMISPWALEQGAPPEVVAQLAEWEWMSRKDDLLFSLNYGLMRGPMIEHQVNVRDTIHLDENFGTHLLDPISKIINPLYQSYQKQGPERALILPQILAQDRVESNRYVRFILSRFVKPLGYAQILTSKNPSEALHVSQEWGEQVADLVRQHPDEVVGELGRLHVIHPNNYQFDYHRAHVTELQDEKGRIQTNRMITHLLLQKLIAWARSDARLDRLLIQINLPVEKVMKINEIPLELGERRLLSKSWNGQRVEEVVYAFDRSAIAKLDRYLTRKVLGYWLEYAYNHRLSTLSDTTQLVLSANEYRAFKETGLYEALFPNRTLPAYPSENADRFGFHMDRKAILRGLEYLGLIKK